MTKPEQILFDAYIEDVKPDMNETERDNAKQFTKAKELLKATPGGEEYEALCDLQYAALRAGYHAGMSTAMKLFGRNISED